MAKAGLFAGEVTQNAPDDGAVTSKFKGYQWMEYGNLVPAGICGDIDASQLGELLSVSPLSLVGQSGAVISEANARLNGCSFTDSKDFGFTCALVRENPPQAGNEVGAFEFVDGTNVAHFAFYLDENGYMNITGRNVANVEILSVQIKNNGGSFTDSTDYLFAVAMKMSDPTQREIWVNNENVTDNTSWVTWTTYTDDLIHFEDSVAVPLHYRFGFGLDHGWGYVSVAGGSTGPITGIDCLGYISFDDTCSLVPSAIWDSEGYVRDCGAWEGWYMVQPEVFYGPSFWKNSGSTCPLYYGQNNMEKQWEIFLGLDYYDTGFNQSPSPIANAVLNVGVAGKTDAT